MKNRRVGTLTLGVVLIFTGILFLMRVFTDAIDVRMILSLWPAVLILLGVEILISYLIQKTEPVRYDGGAIFLMLLVCLFTFCMAGAEFVLENAAYFAIL